MLQRGKLAMGKLVTSSERPTDLYINLHVA